MLVVHLIQLYTVVLEWNESAVIAGLWNALTFKFLLFILVEEFKRKKNRILPDIRVSLPFQLSVNKVVSSQTSS